MNTRTIYAVDTISMDDEIIFFLVKNIKSLSLRFDSEGRIICTRPLHVSIKEAKEFVRKNMDWVKKNKERAIRANNNNPYNHEYTDAEQNAFMAKVSKVFPRCEARMKLYASKVTIRLMKTQWGSCSSRRAISINLALSRLPDECLEYVIIHELAHIVHRDHSDKFWHLVEQYCPDWRRIRASMRN